VFERKQLSRDEVLLTVAGSLSMDASMDFHGQLERLVESRCTVITLDLSRTDSIGSTAMGKILLFKKKLAEEGRTLQIRGCSPNLLSTFQMINFGSLVPIQPLGAVGSGPGPEGQ
jgi:anti-anti-sigma factor